MIVQVNGDPMELAEGATVRTVVERLRVGMPERGIAVAVDAEVVPRTRWDEWKLGDGERIEVLTAIQGG